MHPEAVELPRKGRQAQFSLWGSAVIRAEIPANAVHARSPPQTQPQLLAVLTSRLGFATQKQQVTLPNSYCCAFIAPIAGKDPRETAPMEPHRPGCPRPAPRTAADLAARPEGGAITAAQRAARAAMAAGRLPAVLLLLALLLGGTAGPGARAARSRGAEKQNSFRRAASGLYQGVSGLFGEDNVRALQKVRPLFPLIRAHPRCLPFLGCPKAARRTARGRKERSPVPGSAERREPGFGEGRRAASRSATVARTRPVKAVPGGGGRRLFAGALRPGCGACCALWVRWGRKRC